MAFTPLSERSDFTFPPGTFDVRDWEVKTMADEEKIGKVKDVLLDESGNARYLDVHLGAFKKHILLPIGQARVDESEDVVWVPGMSKDQLEHIPKYEGDPRTITGEYERRLHQAYTGAYAGERYYERPEYHAERPRMTGAGTGGGESRLASLDELADFKVSEEDPDPRGWDVVGSDQRTIGKVSELIVDTSVMKVRYLTVKVDERELGLEPEDRQILIPIGYARLNEDQEQVFLDAISAEDVSRMPRFGGLPLEREQEEELHAAYTGGLTGEERYRHPRYSAERFYGPRRTEAGEGETHIRRAEEELIVGKRDVETGEVDIRTEIDTEIERQPVTRRREEVEIERRPVEGVRADERNFKEEEVRIPLHEEEVVVEKRPEVKEELVVRKRPVEEETEVEAELRKERIEVERHERGREGRHRPERGEGS